jgi:hypothetical protein
MQARQKHLLPLRTHPLQAGRLRVRKDQLPVRLGQAARRIGDLVVRPKGVPECRMQMAGTVDRVVSVRIIAGPAHKREDQLPRKEGTLTVQEERRITALEGPKTTALGEPRTTDPERGMPTTAREVRAIARGEIRTLRIAVARQTAGSRLEAKPFRSETAAARPSARMDKCAQSKRTT